MRAAGRRAAALVVDEATATLSGGPRRRLGSGLAADRAGRRPFAGDGRRCDGRVPHHDGEPGRPAGGAQRRLPARRVARSELGSLTSFATRRPCGCGRRGPHVRARPRRRDAGRAGGGVVGAGVRRRRDGDVAAGVRRGRDGDVAAAYGDATAMTPATARCHGDVAAGVRRATRLRRCHLRHMAPMRRPIPRRAATGPAGGRTSSWRTR